MIMSLLQSWQLYTRAMVSCFHWSRMARIPIVVNCGAEGHCACREVQRILMELLNQMDGFDQNVNVKVRAIHTSLTSDILREKVPCDKTVSSTCVPRCC